VLDEQQQQNHRKQQFFDEFVLGINGVVIVCWADEGASVLLPSVIEARESLLSCPCP